MMKNTTFLNQTIIKELNDNFYFISLNAEENESINFNGQTFEFKPTGPDTGVHELALELGSIDNQLTFPTICFLNKGNEIIYQLNQYAKTEELIVILNQLK
jgi:thioredoxin-related protein